MTDEDRRRAHIAVLERYRDAWASGDVATMFGLYADDFILHWNGSNPLAGTHFGKVAAIRALSAFTQKTERRLVGVSHIMADAERAIMIARENLAGREVERVLMYRTDGAKVLECWVLDADQPYIDSLLNA